MSSAVTFATIWCGGVAALLLLMGGIFTAVSTTYFRGRRRKQEQWVAVPATVVGLGRAYDRYTTRYGDVQDQVPQDEPVTLDSDAGSGLELGTDAGTRDATGPGSWGASGAGSQGASGAGPWTASGTGSRGGSWVVSGTRGRAAASSGPGVTPPPGISLYPAYRFVAEGQVREADSRVGYGSRLPFTFGDTVTILYDPADPTNVALQDDPVLGGTMGVFRWVGLGLLGLAVVVAVIGVVVLATS